MKKILQGALAAMLMASASSAYAQNPTFEWAKSINEGGALTTDMDRNIYVWHSFSGTISLTGTAGTFNFDAANGANYLAKYTPSGDLIWAKQTTLSGQLAYANGAIYAYGDFENTHDFDFGAATSNKTSQGGYDVFISKMDTSANLIWVNAIGSVDNDSWVAVSVSEAGDVYCTGYKQNGGTIDLDPSASTTNVADRFMAKYAASNGALAWSTGTADEMIFDAIKAENGYLYANITYFDTLTFAGNTYTPTNIGVGIAILKLDPATGAVDWATGGIEADLDGEPGWFTISAQGKVSYWARMYFGSLGVVVDYDPSPNTYNITHQKYSGLVNVQFDAQGTFETAGLLENLSSYRLVSDYQGNVYIMGNQTDTTDIDMSSSVNNLISSSVGTGVLLKYTTDNSLVYYEQADTAPLYVRGLVIDNRGALISTQIGQSGSYDIDLTAGVFQINTQHSISKYSQSTFVNVAENQAVASMRLYPNPAASLLNIENAPVGEQLRVVDALGRVVISQTINQANFQLATEALPNGMYLLQAGRQNAQKVLISK